MIRKLKLKFVAICMALVTAVLACVLLSVYFAVQGNVEDLTQQVLHRAILEDGTNQNRPELSITINGDRMVMLPYFTVTLWPNGGSYTAYVTGGTYADLENTEELSAILKDCLSQDSANGSIRDYGLRYLRQDNGLYQKVAFVDTSMEHAMLREMMGSYLRIAAAAFLVLLGVSILLSRWATAPVEKAWKQQRQFLSDASHELKTPLAAIRLLTDSILQTDDIDPATTREFVADIGQEANRLSRITEDLLQLTRLDGDVLPSAAVVDPLPILEQVLRMMELIAEERGITLTYQAEEGCRILGSMDETRQIIYNLVDNAVKYNRDGGRVEVELKRRGEEVLLTVADEGVGIPEEELAKIFQRFYRVDKARSRAAGGTGLGLSIVRDTLEKRGGSISVANRPGGGAVFTVRWPQAEERGEQA